VIKLLTTKGIYLNLEDSTYFYKVRNLKFYFSSQIYRAKFIQKLDRYMTEEKLRLEIRYNTAVLDTLFFATVLYSKIEKRGFRVEVYNEDKTIKDTLTSIPFIDIKMI
jgi:hypothetical protein